MHLLVLQGPNLNMLGQREPTIYGSTTLADIHSAMSERASAAGIELSFVQSNHEGVLVDTLHAHYGNIQGIIINPGALTHYGLSLRDGLALMDVPIIEVHLSNVYARETFRHHSVVAAIAQGQISGLGWHGYLYAIDWFDQRKQA
ncbi:type II 3-dehydroquinate dehydratase [Herpetosiphon geysericola]|uniref:3-dehydroquinate dehydratase n=1 Tax=Herpetosiphon geysericola TaxID=70996 RepID=A0A0P6Y3U0_9CHLR|nr:type II 3-dehydroquinate dehydratase [Herpetosiphon geysericola]KPL90620.1 3-dehydroquinate dehydratase [Herpetosiphon geysericola]